MTPKTVYSLRMDGLEQAVSGLTLEECETSRNAKYYGAWLLTFKQQ